MVAGSDARACLAVIALACRKFEHRDVFLNMQHPDSFEETTRIDQSRRTDAKRRRHGRPIRDMYHRVFFEQHASEQHGKIRDCVVHEQRYVRGDRLYLSLVYSDRRGTEHIVWQLYLPDEMEEQTARQACKCLLTCFIFDGHLGPDTRHRRSLMVFEKQS